MRKRRTPPNEFGKDSLISYLEDGGVHLSRYDSMGIARDLIMYEKNSSGKVNVFPENPELCLSIELKAVWPWFYIYDKRGT